MKAIILAGGLGTRLRAEVPELPKPLAPVSGKPFLAWKLDALAASGFSEIVLSVGFRAQAIIDAFGERYGPLRLRYVREDKPLGTGGALHKALNSVSPDGPIWVMNGDTFVALDHRAMRARHGKPAADLISMALSEVSDGSRYGTVDVENGRVIRFNDKGAHGPARINAGVYLVSHDLFGRRTLPEAFSFEHDFLAAHLPELQIRAFLADGYFIDIGVPADYARAQSELPARASSASSGPSAER